MELWDDKVVGSCEIWMYDTQVHTRFRGHNFINSPIM